MSRAHQCALLVLPSSTFLCSNQLLSSVPPPAAVSEYAGVVRGSYMTSCYRLCFFAVILNNQEKSVIYFVHLYLKVCSRPSDSNSEYDPVEVWGRALCVFSLPGHQEFWSRMVYGFSPGWRLFDTLGVRPNNELHFSWITNWCEQTAANKSSVRVPLTSQWHERVMGAAVGIN